MHRFDNFVPVFSQKTVTDGPTIEVGGSCFPGAHAARVLRRVLAVFRKYTGTLRVLSVNPGSVLWILLTTAKFFACLYCAVCTRGSVVIMLPVLAVFGPSVLFILPVLAECRLPALEQSQYSEHEMYSILESILGVGRILGASFVSVSCELDRLSG